MILRSSRVTAAELESVTGWQLKPEGLCQRERCVPFSLASSDAIDVADVAHALGMPLVEERRFGLWALGPESGGKALATATMPDIALPDVEGRMFRLSSLRGQKVLLVAWASW
jgi:hypothetical protein